MTGRIIGEVRMEIAVEDRQTLLSNKELIEALGYAVNDDGSLVTFTEMKPAGWQVTLGDQTTYTDTEGNFTIMVKEGGATEGAISPPTDTENVWTTFTVDDLVAEGKSPSEIVMAIEFLGPKFMDEGGECCPSLTSTKSMLKDNSYPTGSEVQCLDYDGPINKGQNGSLLAYLGSTCNTRVLAGCCPNEGGTPGQLLFPSLYTYSSCSNNHKGRWCQEVTSGDVVVTPIGETTVALGDEELVNVHNNACFGETHVSQTKEDLGGALVNDARYDGSKVKHYSGSSVLDFNYDATDWVLTYQAPKCVDSVDLKDEFQFEADGTTVTLTIGIKKENLWKFDSSVAIFSGEGVDISSGDEKCESLHVHGAHPCTGTDDPDPEHCGHGTVTQIF